MNTDFASAVYTLHETVTRACARAEDVLTAKEIATELRRIADEIEEEDRG